MSQLLEGFQTILFSNNSLVSGQFWPVFYFCNGCDAELKVVAIFTNSQLQELIVQEETWNKE